MNKNSRKEINIVHFDRKIGRLTTHQLDIKFDGDFISFSKQIVERLMHWQRTIILPPESNESSNIFHFFCR